MNTFESNIDFKELKRIIGYVDNGSYAFFLCK